MATLLWFRRDLRLNDLPALSAAVADDADVLCCFVLDPRLESSAGPRRLQFLSDSLRDLQCRLGGRLLVTRGFPQERIPLIAAEVAASAVHVSADYTPFGQRRDAQVRNALGSVPLVETGSPYLVAPGRVVKEDGTPYRVFTPFFRRWRDHGWRRPASSGAESARWIDPAALPGTTAEPVEIPDPEVQLDWQAGEQAALETWVGFADSRLYRYERDRDHLDRNGCSRMSPYLKFGNIHPRTMVVDLDLRASGSEAYLRELAFRDFYAAVLHYWPRSAWRNWNPDFDALRTDDDAAARHRFELWKAGETGFPIVDAGMRQLRETGFMHNRVRMIVASFLVKDLHLPWQWGARWFLEQLVDGDIANNQHGWQWSAGSGTDASPYFRVFNPTLQGSKFDPDGVYVRRWIPELADVDDPHQLRSGRPAGYPEPIVDHRRERVEALRRYECING